MRNDTVTSIAGYSSELEDWVGERKLAFSFAVVSGSYDVACRSLLEVIRRANGMTSQRLKDAMLVAIEPEVSVAHGNIALETVSDAYEAALG